MEEQKNDEVRTPLIFSIPTLTDANVEEKVNNKKVERSWRNPFSVGKDYQAETGGVHFDVTYVGVSSGTLNFYAHGGERDANTVTMHTPNGTCFVTPGCVVSIKMGGVGIVLSAAGVRPQHRTDGWFRKGTEQGDERRKSEKSKSETKEKTDEPDKDDDGDI